MEEKFQSADELGPAKIFHVQEPSIGLRATLVVDTLIDPGGIDVAQLIHAKDDGRSVCDQAQARGVLPREAALDVALRRLKQAMGYRRFFIF